MSNYKKIEDAVMVASDALRDMREVMKKNGIEPAAWVSALGAELVDVSVNQSVGVGSDPMQALTILTDMMESMAKAKLATQVSASTFLKDAALHDDVQASYGEFQLIPITREEAARIIGPIDTNSDPLEAELRDLLNRTVGRIKP